MTWLSIIIAGIVTYFARMTMVAIVSRDMMGDKIKAVLAYVPSAVFPAIIFPGVFINDYGTFIEINDPNWCTPFKSIPGVLMEYRVERFNVIMHFTAVEVQKAKIEDSEFFVPKKYKEISIGAMEKALKDLKDIGS